MKLTLEQLYDISAALRRGWSASAWEGVLEQPWLELTDQEKVAVLAAVRSVHEELIRRMNPDLRAINQQFLDRMELSSVQREDLQEQELRAKFLRLPPEKRGTPSGYRQAINDRLSQSRFFDTGQRRAIEPRLAARKRPNLTRLEALFRKKHGKILKRGKIRTEEEYHLVQEILASVDFPIDEKSRQQLACCAHDFETRIKPRQ